MVGAMLDEVKIYNCGVLKWSVCAAEGLSLKCEGGVAVPVVLCLGVTDRSGWPTHVQLLYAVTARKLGLVPQGSGLRQRVKHGVLPIRYCLVDVDDEGEVWVAAAA
jgi:hypothetical protein